MTHDKHHNHHPQRKRAIHTDWRAWAVVGLMLVAMVAYIMSLNESIRPRSDGQAVPAMVGGE